MADPAKTTAPGRIEISSHIRVLRGAKTDEFTGWAIWDDYAEECPVYRTKREAVTFARQMAAEYANGDR